MTDATESLDRTGHTLEFDEQFEGAELDRSRWLPYYLPHWSSRDCTLARYALGDGMLRLRIEADQPPWAPDLDGDLRVSNLQTGTRSGAVGSLDGQHRFRDGQVVRESQPEERLYLPSSGLIELRARGIVDPRSMVALWLIGFEDSPENSGEICIFEQFASEVSPDGTGLVGVGVHPHNDPRIRDDFEKIAVPNVLDFHVYSVEWGADRIRFFVDDVQVHEVAQAIDYPMQLMLDIYEFPGERTTDDVYPKEFVVDWVKGWR